MRMQDLEFIPSHLAVTLTLHSSKESTTSLREVLHSAPPDALNLLEKLLVFNPNKRPTADEALKHPYVARFHNIHNEPSLEEAVIPCLRDDVQLSVDVYRNKLYELIASRKNKNKIENLCDCRTSESSCDFDHPHDTPQNNSVKSHLVTINGKYGVVHTDFKDKTRHLGNSKNGSILKSHSKSDNYPISVKNRSNVELNEPVKVTVVARSFEKQKSKGWELFNKKIPKDKPSMNNILESSNYHSPELLKAQKAVLREGTADVKMNNRHTKDEIKCSQFSSSPPAAHGISRKDRATKPKAILNSCISKQTHEIKTAIKE